MMLMGTPGHPGPFAPPATARPLPVNAALALGKVPPGALPPAKVRMQGPDAVRPASRLVLPSPTELGLSPAAPTLPAPTTPVATRIAVDWNLTHQRLKEIGAVGLHVDHPSAAQVRVTFWLPTAEPGRTQLIEAVAGSEGEAVHLALRQAETARLVRP